jgi:hypothetical protein
MGGDVNNIVKKAAVNAILYSKISLLFICYVLFLLKPLQQLFSREKILANSQYIHFDIYHAKLFDIYHGIDTLGVLDAF